MHPVIAYLLKMGLCSAILLGYYWLALRNTRFHQWNRFYLLAAMLLSITVPLLQISLLAEDEPATVVSLVAALPWNRVASNPTPVWTMKNTLVLTTVIISAAMLLHLLLGVAKIIKMYRTHQHTSFKEVSVVITEAQTAPFSFFKWLFWRQDIDPDSENGQRMLQHELTHISEKHSADKLFAEALLIIFWMNPFFWIIRRELYAIHEFLADRQAIARYDGAAFAAMILQAAHAHPTPSLSNPFFTSHLKRRLIMITTSSEPKYSYLRRISGLLLMIATGFVLVLGIEKATAQQAPPPPPAPVQAPTPVDAPDGQWTKLPDSIKNAAVIDKKGVCYIRYEMKDGRKFTYELNEAKKKGYFIPPPPPPVPGVPAPPQPPNPPSREENKEAPAQAATVNKGDEPLYVYAGIIISKAQMEQIDPNNIDRVDVLKGDKAIAMYGQKGAGGVVMITPKAASIPTNGTNNPNQEVVVVGYPIPSASSQTEGQVKVAANNNAKPDLIMLDGKRITLEEMNALSPNDIATVNVMKGEMAIRKYGAIAKNGVIDIVSKKASDESRKASKELYINFGSYLKKPASTANLGIEAGKNPLIIVNGKEMTQDQLRGIGADAIETIDIIKDANILKSYGDKAKDGLIMVHLKC